MGNEDEEDEIYFPWFKAMTNASPKNLEEIGKELELLYKKFTEKKLLLGKRNVMISISIKHFDILLNQHHQPQTN